MGEQYFEQNPSSRHDERYIDVNYKGIKFIFKTDAGVFSKNQLDFGSRVLLDTMIEENLLTNQALVAEFGSGYGPISIILSKLYQVARFTAVELNQRASLLSQENAHLNKVSNIDWVNENVENLTQTNQFDLVITNPPIRAGKQVIQMFVEKAQQILKEKGSLILVIQKKQGAPSMKKFMEECFGNVERLKLEKGYWILKATKNNVDNP